MDDVPLPQAHSGTAKPQRSALSRFLRHPAVWALVAALAIMVAGLVPAWWQLRAPLDGARTSVHRDAPWESDITADGSIRALGLRLPGATLADAQALWSQSLQVVLRSTLRDDELSLEAKVDNASPGGVSGRLILQAQASQEQLKRWRSRPAKEEWGGGQTRNLMLRPDDLQEALQLPIRVLAMLPQAQLDEATVRQRFGEPQRVLRESASVQHWLYPARGLAVMIDAQGRDLLRFAPPAQFKALLEVPLETALKSASTAASKAAARPATSGLAEGQPG